MKLKTKTRAPKILKPSIALKPNRKRVDAGERIAVSVALAGVDRVELSLEPKQPFELDLRSMRKSGIVRLRGRADGIATLIASGRVGTKEVIRKMVHLRCDGPQVRILEYGYEEK
jgi:hypothetical protein